MAQHPSFYETVQEANMRLRGTFLLYDGIPHVVLCVTNHREDGIFRIYLEPIGYGEDALACNQPGTSPPIHAFQQDDPTLGHEMDKWLLKMLSPEQGGKGPGTRVVRKAVNSAKFNKFRPFPLGMMNTRHGSVLYLERQPNRKTEQGLTHSMILSSGVNLQHSADDGRRMRSLPRGDGFDMYGPLFRACLLGEHPSAEECLSALKDPEISNDAAAFHRRFAFVRGPLRMIFLAHKTDIIGVLPHKDLSCLRLGRDHQHTREIVDALDLFGVVIQD